MKKKNQNHPKNKNLSDNCSAVSVHTSVLRPVPPAHPSPFTAGVPFPTAVAAAPDLWLVSEYCSENIDQVDCNGNATLFATLPGFGSCREKYMTIAPSMSANAGFTPRDVFTTEGSQIFKITGGIVTLFTTLSGCPSSDHNGITFDHFGTFGND